ncbi:phage terminase large subunit [Yersinia ruckeri]|uniref:phage terminase large subunit n=1 Tax=Yersinia ruckeri TaxID=29486 RepID=UPI0009BD837A|nr:phage terminase large subunit [Yersinia ruckeri]MCW6525300.1 phage terminase large subunit [Yersinia ruckeri]MCW6592914.1 phage terminase large subunit [Yersinia ruckeri]MCW6605597.1 phage terminase large subunit [Yersinia ruckeri]UIN14971.1 phage terminase large subunit [Yersinia ruckeri]UIN18350.1 phage terminase large subunit [Yersinia ruckeri]
MADIDHSSLGNRQTLEAFKRRAIAEARESLMGFTLYTNPLYETGWFNELLSAELDHFLAEVEAGNMPRLMIFAPPRSGKSEKASRRFPAYVLGKHPDWNVIACSYSSDLANRMSRDTQRIVGSKKYSDVFPDTALPSGRTGAGGAIRTAELWEVTNGKGEIHGGSYRAAGVNGGITGQGMNIGIIDDPAKDYKTASSPTYQESVIDWYDTTFFTRADPKINGIIIILTRWHQNDLAGQLLKKAEEGGEQWRVVSFPMEAEKEEVHELDGKTYLLRKPGEILFPERMPQEFVDKAKQRGSLVWNALYQQRPTAKGGGLIKTHWFGEYSELPVMKWRAVYGDTAQKIKEVNDFSVFEHWGLGVDGYMYLIDMIRGKWESDELKRRAVAFWTKSKQLRNGPLRHMAIEDKSSGTGLIQSIRKDATCPVKAIQRDKDKYTRLMDTQGYIESGYIKLPKEAPFINDFLVEMEAINPEFNTHDDQLDPMMDAITEMKGKSGVLFHIPDEILQ